MTTTERMRTEREKVEEQIAALKRRQHEITLAIEEAEGRPESRDARYARAVLAGDQETLTRLADEGAEEFRRVYGYWPGQSRRSASEGAEAQP